MHNLVMEIRSAAQDIDDLLDVKDARIEKQAARIAELEEALLQIAGSPTGESGDAATMMDIAVKALEDSASSAIRKPR